MKKTFLFFSLVSTQAFYAQVTTPTQAIDYLNTLRSSVGLHLLKQNSILTLSAQNHTNYVQDTQLLGHYEDNATYPSKFYTAITPLERGRYAGYQASYFLENFSAGQKNLQQSIDSLMSAIYHRYGFLNNNIDEIGIGYSISNLIYTYNMANSKLNTLCLQESYEEAQQSYTFNVCKDPDFKIISTTYNNTLNTYPSTSPDIVVWPYDNAQKMLNAFFEESPDPLPQQNVSGYPISLEFNAFKYKNKTITIKSFKLYDAYDNEIKNTFLMDENNDPNQKHTPYQFTLFPLQRLDFNALYFVKVIYEIDGEEQYKKWKFTTENFQYPYFIFHKNDEVFQLESGKTYLIYLPPRDANDVFNSLSYVYNTQEQNLSLKDPNTLLITLQGDEEQYCNIEMKKNNEVTASFSCIVKKTSNAILPKDDITIPTQTSPFIYYTLEEIQLKTNIPNTTTSTSSIQSITTIQENSITLEIDTTKSISYSINNTKTTLPLFSELKTLEFLNIDNEIQIRLDTTLSKEIIFQGNNNE